MYVRRDEVIPPYNLRHSKERENEKMENGKPSGTFSILHFQFSILLHGAITPNVRKFHWASMSDSP